MNILKEGEVIRDRYKIKRVLGKGGMSTVYLVEDLKLPEKLWAMKEIGGNLPEDLKGQTSQQFSKEAEILAHLTHPRLPKVTNFFTTKGQNYLIMEYLQGKTLTTMMNEIGGFIDEEKIRKWGIEICEVLEYLHSQNPPVIFRDIKPDNIIIDPDDHIKLIDFGIARLFDPGKKEDTIVIGTPGFASPEQYGKCQTDERSDIYSLGATLYCLATALNPAEKPFSFLIPSSVNPAISSDLDSILLKCLDIDPKKRYSSAYELKKALRGNATSTLSLEVSPSVSALDIVCIPDELTFSIPPGRNPEKKILTIRNRGRKPLRATLSTNKSWLTVAPEFFEANEKEIEVTVHLKEERREREYRGKILLTTPQKTIPIPVKAHVLPTLWEREMPHLIISILLFFEALVPLLGIPGIVVTYLMLNRQERVKQKILFIVALFVSLLILIWFLQ